MSTPHVPPRPQRNPAKSDVPLIPPRPIRNTDPSPDRGTRSPLNFPPTSLGSKPHARSGRTSEDLPNRPPSVALPDLGHEGDEYSSFDQLPTEARVSASGDEAKTTNVSADLPMHQPRASVPQSTAKRQIHTVTSTDSTQAAAAGIGRSRPADDVHKMPPQDGTTSPMRRVTSNEPRRPPSIDQSLRSKTSFTRSTSSLQPLERTISRPGSIHGGEDHEHGIPEIGQQIPLNRWAGDAQAPSPAAGLSQHAPGIGFFNDGSSKNHHRKRSSRHEFGPPDSYGIRHDQDHQDQFEQEWARKHPQEAVKEGYHHQHLPKPETALSSDQLNRLIHGDLDAIASQPLGTPDEDEAFEATEAYSSRIGTPHNADTNGRNKRASSGEATTPRGKAGFFGDKNHLRPENALDDEPQASPRRRSNITRGDTDDEHEHENTDGTPILASDEILKRPNSAFMHAAVDFEPHPDDFYDSDHGQSGRRNSGRPTSGPSSVHGAAAANYTGGSLHRFVSHEEQHHSGVGTPLEEIEEYEPLFPEDEKESEVRKKVLKKRPDLAHHHFPSQDVWEDTPASLHYSTTVSTPDLERRELGIQTVDSSTSTFETPEHEAKRINQNPHDMTSDAKTFVKPQFKAGVVQDLHHERPSAHRFPSSDVWEDSPDSVRLETTVAGPQEDEITSSQDDRPAVPSRPQRHSRLAQEVTPAEVDPARSPDKPKPVIPARPARIGQSEQSRSIDETVTSQKPKPAVPARPAGEKLASLKAGFMNDLNNRLKLGPQGPPPKAAEAEVEEEAERAPLTDARKGRAKGPPRRKPAAAPVADRKSSLTFAMSPLITVWTIDEEDEVQVHEKENKEPTVSVQPMEKTLGLNGLENTDAAAPIMSPLSPQELATNISNSERPGTAAGEHLASQAELEAALAAAGAGPATFEGREGKDSSVQTGETESKTTLSGGSQEKHNAHLSGKAPDEGDVFVKQADELSNS